MSDQSSHDPLERVFTDLDRPVSPASDFARTLRAKLIVEATNEHPDSGDQTQMSQMLHMTQTIPLNDVGQAERFPASARHKLPRAMVLMEIAAAIVLLLGTLAVLSNGSSVRDRLAGLVSNQQQIEDAPLGQAAMLGGDAGRTGQQPGPAPENEFVGSWTLPVEGVNLTGFAPVGLGDTVYRVVADILAANPNVPPVVLQAVNVANGDVRWQAVLDVWGSPAVTEDLVFVNVQPSSDASGGTPARLVALDAGTGEVVWRVDLDVTDRWSSDSSPVVIGDIVYTASASGSVIAVKGRTGVLLWRSTEAVSTSQAVPASDTDAGQIAGNASTIFVVDTANDIVALSAETGKKRWSIDVSARFQIQPDLTRLIVLKDIMILRIGGLDNRADAKTSDDFVMMYAAVEAANGEDLWRRDFVTDGGSPVLINGQLVLATVGTAGNELVAVNPGTGETTWSHAWSDGIPLAMSTSGDLLVVSSSSRNLYGYEMTNDQLWSIPLEISSPFPAVVVGERLIVQGQSGALYGFSANSSDESPLATASGTLIPTTVPVEEATSTPFPATMVPEVTTTATPFPTTLVTDESATATPIPTTGVSNTTTPTPAT